MDDGPSVNTRGGDIEIQRRCRAKNARKTERLLLVIDGNQRYYRC